MDVFVVGNGPSAVKNDIGAEIDEFECVVRFNRFTLLPSFTGYKTDVVAVNEGHTDRPRALIAVPWTKPIEPCLYSRLFYGLNLPMVSEDVAREASDRFHGTGYWASTGIITLAHYIGIGCNVWHSGFDHFAPGKHHYADDNIPFCGHHSHHMEVAWMLDLLRSGRLFPA